MRVLQSQYVLRCLPGVRLNIYFQTLQVWHVGSATADVVISIYMCYYVRFFFSDMDNNANISLTTMEMGYWFQENTYSYHKTYSA